MKILNPVNNGVLTQPYGAHPEFYEKYFGIKWHNGSDEVSFHGDELYCPEDGIAYKIYDLSHGSITKGFGVCILGNPDENGICNEHVLWHTMSNIFPKQGEKVRQGNVMAFEGDSGQVYVGGVAVLDEAKGKPPFPGTHLHWGKRKVKIVDKVTFNACLANLDGSPYQDSNGKFYEIQDVSNGVQGFIDPFGEPVIEYGDFIEEQAVSTVVSVVEEAKNDHLERRNAILAACKNFLNYLLSYIKGRNKS